MADEFEASKDWEEKMSFMPGVLFDEAPPVTLYQVLLGKVYCRTTWTDGTVARGELPLTDLEVLFGKPIVTEGWYDAQGKYLGSTI